jgi:hypothetical protein
MARGNHVQIQRETRGRVVRFVRARRVWLEKQIKIAIEKELARLISEELGEGVGSNEVEEGSTEEEVQLVDEGKEFWKEEIIRRPPMEKGKEKQMEEGGKRDELALHGFEEDVGDKEESPRRYIRCPFGHGYCFMKGG